MEWLSEWKAIIQTPPSPLPFNIFLFSPFLDSTQCSRSSLSGYSSCLQLDSTCTPFFLPLIAYNAPLPSPFQPFIPCSLTSSFICPCVPSSITTHPSLSSSLFYCLLFHFCRFPLLRPYLFSGEPLTEALTKEPSWIKTLDERPISILRSEPTVVGKYCCKLAK